MAASAARVLNQLVDQVGDGPEYEFEDPASWWINLVIACRCEPELRRAAVETCLVEARNSHWTEELWAEELAICTEDPGIEWGGDVPEDAHSMKE